MNGLAHQQLHQAAHGVGRELAGALDLIDAVDEAPEGLRGPRALLRLDLAEVDDQRLGQDLLLRLESAADGGVDLRPTRADRLRRGKRSVRALKKGRGALRAIGGGNLRGRRVRGLCRGLRVRGR